MVVSGRVPCARTIGYEKLMPPDIGLKCLLVQQEGQGFREQNGPPGLTSIPRWDVLHLSSQHQRPGRHKTPQDD
jgi:hypothetical protein